MINETAKWNNRISIMFSLLLVITLNLYAAGVETLQWANSIGEGMEEAKKTNKPIMIDFYTDWWSWCKRLDADTFTDKKVIELSKNFVVLKVNPEDKNHPENEEIRRKYGISGYPAIVFLSSKGDLISSNAGFRPPDQFSELMNKTLKEENELKRLRAEIQKNPNDLKVNVDLAMIYIKRGNLERGQTLVDKIQELDPSNQFRVLPQVYAEMALAHANQGNIVEGQALLDKVLALDLKDESAYLSKLHVSFGLFYGQNAEKRGNEDYFQKAEKHFNTVIQKYPQSKLYEGAQLYLGITYAIQEKKQMAISLLEKLSSHAKDAYIQERADHILETLKKQAE